MPYTIKLSDGHTNLITVPDRQVIGPLALNAPSNCSLNLVGRGSQNYGFPTNTNFVWMLQNFANNTPPVSPLAGQLWYNTNSVSSVNNTTTSTLQLYNSLGQWTQVATSDAPIIFSNDVTVSCQTGPTLSLITNSSSTPGNILISFNYANSQVGSITTNGSGVSYNTTSDYRLKNIIGPADVSWLSRLPVYKGAFKITPNEQQPMVLAHELAEHFPVAVTGEKDAIDDNGKPIYQQINWFLVIPALIAYTQSLETKILSRIDALEAQLAKFAK